MLTLEKGDRGKSHDRWETIWGTDQVSMKQQTKSRI